MCLLAFCLSRGRLFGILSTVALSMAFCDFDGQIALSGLSDPYCTGFC